MAALKTRLEKVASPPAEVVAVLPETDEVVGVGVRVMLTPLSLTGLPYWSSTWTVGRGGHGGTCRHVRRALDEDELVRRAGVDGQRERLRVLVARVPAFASPEVAVMVQV